MSQEQASSSNTTKPKDPVFKRLIQDYFEAAHLTNQFTVTPGLQVGQLQLEIDAAITAQAGLTQEEIDVSLAATPFWFFRHYNLVEFKSIADPLDETDFGRITARALLAWAEPPPGVERTSVVSCIVSAAKPHNLLKQLKPGGRAFRQIKPGIYYHPGFVFPVYIIVCNQLPLDEANYPLLIFSSGTKLKNYLEKLVDSRFQVYLNYAVRLHPEESLEWLKRRSKLTTKEQKEREMIYQALVDHYGVMGLIRQSIQIQRNKGEEGKSVLNEAYQELVDVVGLKTVLQALVEKIEPDQLVEILGPERIAKIVRQADEKSAGSGDSASNASSSGDNANNGNDQ